MIDWVEINAPWFEIDEFVDILVDKVHILDILDKWNIEYADCQSGEFSHRLRCPLPAHLSGGERTASFFVSQTQNKFYCFGCNSGGSIIDFVSLYAGKPFYEVVRWLASYAGITNENLEENLKNLPKREKRDPEKLVSTYIFRTGIFIRDNLNKIKDKKEYTKRCEWADQKFIKLDKYLDKLSDDEWEVAKAYHDKTIKYLKSKI